MFILIGISPFTLALIALAIAVGVGVTAGTLVAMVAIVAGALVASLGIVYAINRSQKAPPRHQLSRAEAHAIAQHIVRESSYNPLATASREELGGPVYQREIDPPKVEYHWHWEGLTEEQVTHYIRTRYGNGEPFAPEASYAALREPYEALPALESEGEQPR